jgi:predicted nucleotidyltransferase
VVPDELIQRAARALADAARPPVKVVLFGSHARGDADPDSDVDFLVIEREVEDRFDEIVRLGRLLGDLRVPADVVVVSEEQVEEWGDVEGTMLHEALEEGRIVAEA